MSRNTGGAGEYTFDVSEGSPTPGNSGPPKKSALPPARLGLIAIGVMAILAWFVSSRGGPW